MLFYQISDEWRCIYYHHVNSKTSHKSVRDRAWFGADEFERVCRYSSIPRWYCLGRMNHVRPVCRETFKLQQQNIISNRHSLLPPPPHSILHQCLRFSFFKFRHSTINLPTYLLTHLLTYLLNHCLNVTISNTEMRVIFNDKLFLKLSDYLIYVNHVFYAVNENKSAISICWQQRVKKSADTISFIYYLFIYLLYGLYTR